MTTNDIKNIQVQLVLNDGMVLFGQTDNQIIKNIMVQFVKFSEVKPELIGETRLKDILK